jgi:acyl-CoA synthetase (AMP-forming)/AMP-acid ligase II
MIVTGGENVYSKEVEDAIAACPGVAAAAVIGIPHKEWGETVAAFVIPAKEANLTEEKLRDFLADKLAKYKIPKHVHFLDELPRNDAGKIDRQQLRIISTLNQ